MPTSNKYTISDDSSLSLNSTKATWSGETTSSIKITRTDSSHWRLQTVSVTSASSGGPTVSSISITGSMSDKEYSTVDSWDNNGLSADVIMNNNSSYSGTVDWLFNPASPAAYALSNEAEVTNGSLSITASAGGKSASKTETGISVNYATVAQGSAATPATGTLTNVIVKGIVSQIDEVSTQYGNATYYVSDDGTTTNQLKVYHGKYLDDSAFTNTNQIQVGDIVVIYGGLTTYSGAPQFAAYNYLLSLDRPATLDPSITITNSDFSMLVGDEDVSVSETHENLPSGGSIAWESSPASVAIIVNDNGYKVRAVGAGSATITAKILDSNSVMVASNSIHVTVLDQALEDGDTFVIKAAYNQETYYLSEVSGNIGTATTDEEEAMVLTAIESETPNHFQLKNGNNYLSFSGSSNNLYTTTDDEANSTFWTVLTNGTNEIIENVNSTGRKLQFNHSSGTPANRFACYTSNQVAVQVEKVAAPVESDHTITFNSNGGSAVASQTVQNLGLVTEPSSPTKDGYTFGGWYSDENLENEYNFATPVTSSFTLFAKWIKSGAEALTSEKQVYVKITSTEDLTDGKYLIVYEDGNVAFDGSLDSLDKVSNTVNVEIENSRFISYSADLDSSSFTIETIGSDKYLKSSSGLYIGRTSNSNGFETSESADEGFESVISFDDEGNVLISTSAGPTLKYNSAKDQLRFRYYKSGQKDVQLYKYVNLEDYLTDFVSFANLYATETEEEGAVSVSGVNIRFGATISEEKWNAISSIWEIADYGVKLVKKTTGSYTSLTPVQDRIAAKKSVSTFNKGSGDAPTAVEGVCTFEVKINVTNYGTNFYAAPYILVGDKPYFLDEVHASVNELAQNYSGSELSDDALDILAH